jgi:hypothetical protein
MQYPRIYFENHLAFPTREMNQRSAEVQMKVKHNINSNDHISSLSSNSQCFSIKRRDSDKRLLIPAANIDRVRRWQ